MAEARVLLGFAGATALLYAHQLLERAGWSSAIVAAPAALGPCGLALEIPRGGLDAVLALLATHEAWPASVSPPPASPTGDLA